VGDKIFAGYGDDNGRQVIGFKLTMEHAKARVGQDSRFSPAPYVGHKGWVSMNAAVIRDWSEVRGLIVESYRLIASKKSLAKLDEAHSGCERIPARTRRRPRP
jgi:predicted DNA-binding protein (MmcQ/YjbR family)